VEGEKLANETDQKKDDDDIFNVGETVEFKI